MITEEGDEVQILDDENEPSGDIIDEKTGKRKPKKKKLINKEGEIEDVQEIIESDVQSQYDENGNKLPKKKKYINKKGDIIELEEKEPSEEEPSEHIEKKTKKKIKKVKKPKTMITEEGDEVQILDDENEPSGDIIDEKTGKRIIMKEKEIWFMLMELV